MTTSNQIEKLAADMGVKPEDVKCLMTSVAISIEKDGMKERALKMNEADFTGLVEAYVIDAIKKFDRLACRIKTDARAKDAFYSYVRSIV